MNAAEIKKEFDEILKEITPAFVAGIDCGDGWEGDNRDEEPNEDDSEE